MSPKPIHRRQFSQMLASPLLASPLLMGPLSMAALTACQTTAAPPPEQVRSGGKLALGVAAVDIINDYTPAGAAPYIDHEFMPTPTVQLTQWAEQTLTPDLDDGNVLVAITKASLKEVEIAGDDGLKALFTNEQRLLVTVEFEAIFSFTHPLKNRSATLTVVSSAQSSIPDNATPDDAQRIRQRVVRNGIGRFDQELRRQLRQVSEGIWPLKG
ncbi:MAG: hypothetical protein J4F41_04875 [Alphaproteobacteria bacterium]|nr:hypothetical protein [Alphaproteobacteria bacterium]